MNLAPPLPKRAWPRAATWLVRVLLVLLVLPLALLLISTIYHGVASALDQRNHPPPGQLIDIGGYRLHLYCTGSGSPTVLLDAANQGTVSNWAWVQPAIAQTTQVCAYDRAGAGWSELSPTAQDTRQNAEALHTLLAKAQVPAPYVLVGHSFGGLYVRMFADMYPADVAGMVLIEATLPDGLQTLGKPDVMPNAPDAGMIDAAPIVSQLGLLRLLNFPATDPDLPAPQRQALQAYLSSTKWAENIKRQYHLFPTLLGQVRPLYSAKSLGNIPLAVVLGEQGDGGIAEWRALFEVQAALSTRGTIHRIAGANHISLVDRQPDAAQTSAIITDVVAHARAP